MHHGRDATPGALPPRWPAAPSVPSVRTTDGLGAIVQQIVTRLLPDGPPNVHSVAELVRMSSRTLQRRLSRESLTFAGVVARARPRHGAANARRSRPKGHRRRAGARLLRSRSLHARLRALDGRGSAPIPAASRDGVLRRPGIEITFVAITMPRHPRPGHLLGDRTSERIREREPLSVGRPHSVIGIETTVGNLDGFAT
jgi:hypothetical protein